MFTPAREGADLLVGGGIIAPSRPAAAFLAAENDERATLWAPFRVCHHRHFDFLAYLMRTRRRPGSRSPRSARLGPNWERTSPATALPSMGAEKKLPWPRPQRILRSSRS